MDENNIGRNLFLVVCMGFEQQSDGSLKTENETR